jgi:hypothetical protein
MNTIIRKLTETFLFEPSNYKGLYDSAHNLHQVFSEASGIKAGDITDENIFLPSGKAVSPIRAAHCLLEFHRTAVFLRGIYKAILHLKKEFPGERLHILYAGCGPYATLLTPLTTFFTKDELAFHLLDINQDSLDAAQKLYNNLELNNYVEEWIYADATTYKVSDDSVIHLMISETMLNALRKEPQVEIMLNLIPQLPPEGIFIPHEITITAKLLSRRLETDRHMNPDQEPERINLGEIYKIGRKYSAPSAPVTINIPAEMNHVNYLSLLTDINTFENEKLGIYECSLNMPVHLTNAQEYAGGQLTFEYETGELPGFKYYV